MRGTRFRACDAGRAWLVPRDCRDLAKLCEGSRLTIIQAEVVRLAGVPLDYRDIALTLSLPYGVARDVARRAEERIRSHQSWVRRALLTDLSETLYCLKNSRNPNPKPAWYRKVPGGWEGVALHPRPAGAVPEDWSEEPGRLLRSLPRLLVGRRESRSAN